MAAEGGVEFGTEEVGDFRSTTGNTPVEHDLAPGAGPVMAAEGDGELMADRFVVRRNEDQPGFHPKLGHKQE